MSTPPSLRPQTDLVCFSHLRWDFVYQRPQHLMSRFGRGRRVLYIEEPVFEAVVVGGLRVTPRGEGVQVVVPVLPEGIEAREGIDLQRALLSELIESTCTPMPTFWFQTPMALPIAPVALAGVVIYDCMDELSAFLGAPPSLVFNEKALLARADLVFTGGVALYEAKQAMHPAVHCFPSGIDVAHFARARRLRSPLVDAPRRIGFSGVIDERFDVGLLDAVALLRPETRFEIVGPVVKIDPRSLPQRDNVSYLGLRRYDDLPEIMAQWDAAIMPFALNDATRYISPTKTPEYLAAGLPVVSTSVRDVVRQYGDLGIVAIADGAEEFAAALDDTPAVSADRAWRHAVDDVLQARSWEATWSAMASLEAQSGSGRHVGLESVAEVR